MPRSKKTSRKKVNQDLLSILFLAFLSLAFFWQFFLKGLLPIPADIIVGIYYPWRDQIWNGLTAGVPVKNGLLSDVVSIIYPWRIYGIGLIKSGIAPLWIPHALSGMPLLANFQSALFYPLNFLFWIFSNVNAWSLYIILQPILASVFCFLYLRNLRLSTLASLFGAFIFAFSGFTLVWLEYGIVGHAGLWLPLMLLSVDKLKSQGKKVWLIVGSFAVSFSLFAGYPQISLFAILLTFLYILFRFWSERKRALLAGFVFIGLGIALSAVQLVPGLQMWLYSIRQLDSTTSVFNYGVLPLKNLILAIAPDFFGNPTTGNFWGQPAYNESAFYVGFAGLIFAIFSLFSFKKDVSLFFKLIFFLSLLFAFQTPLANLPRILGIPGLNTASAGRFLFFTTFSFSILSAFGVELFLHSKKAKFVLFMSLFFCLILVALWALVLINKDDNHFLIAKRNLILPSLIFIFTQVFLIYALRGEKFRKPAIFIVFLILVFDLFRFGWKYNTFSLKDYLYPDTELTKFLQEKTGISRFIGLIPQSMFIPYDLLSPEGYDPMLSKNYSEFTNQVNEEKFSPVSAGSRWVKIHRQDASLLDLMAVKYILSFNVAPVSDFDQQYFKFPKEKYRLVFQKGKSQVYENLNALPHAFLVHDYLVLNNRNEILGTLKSEAFDPKSLLVLEEVPSIRPQLSEGEDEVSMDEQGYFQNKVRIQTKSDKSSFLFISDNYYPGWQALVDGVPTKIYRANYTFRAVALPAGEHQVEFLFQPQSFKIGVIVSLGTFIFLMTLLGYEIFKSRTSSPKRSARLV